MVKYFLWKFPIVTVMFSQDIFFKVRIAYSSINPPTIVADPFTWFFRMKLEEKGMLATLHGTWTGCDTIQGNFCNPKIAKKNLLMMVWNL